MPAHPTNLPARCHALLPCAGTGSRAGTAAPKQYQPLAGTPLVLHTLGALAKVGRLATVLVVVAPDDRRMPPGDGYTVAGCGGDTRAASVANGLGELQRLGAADHDWVLVHDAARCLVTPDLVDRLIDACQDDDVGGLLAQPLADTLKAEEGGRVGVTLPRQGKWLAQTPQMFRIAMLRRALAQAGTQVTDEASAIEALGLRPLLVAGSAANFKVTWPEDFALAEAVLRSRAT
ncbi:MAG TPA: 2-C-methyl-D-erythritol 4-phosphate cytidylyltransferase [Ramlibacter sp.]|uniref:2-C-methyl-D-erythritol 4-phosphate cytidylyltransferase n=1 Tax=Ramlibacter sp. TaxID=1917967 RepID=UPI002D433C3A|nr:2-C-methyl-D-erythritol 4-phosphate cytidylyltransferase [Ramlibacter sp.]HZY18169.1 2-C-methyl-D-erythritol 4-phosphate cytidylyltransferase [Ramlibacter sp.]